MLPSNGSSLRPPGMEKCPVSRRVRVAPSLPQASADLDGSSPFPLPRPFRTSPQITPYFGPLIDRKWHSSSHQRRISDINRNPSFSIQVSRISVAADGTMIISSKGSRLHAGGATSGLSTQRVNYPDPSLSYPWINPVTLLPRLPDYNCTDFRSPNSRFTRIESSSSREF